MKYKVKMYYNHNGIPKIKEFEIPLGVLLTRKIKIEVENIAIIVELQNSIWNIEEECFISNIGDLIKDNCTAPELEEDEVIIEF